MSTALNKEYNLQLVIYTLSPFNIYGGREGHFRIRNADSKIGTAHREIDIADSDLQIDTADSDL